MTNNLDAHKLLERMKYDMEMFSRTYLGLKLNKVQKEYYNKLKAHVKKYHNVDLNKTRLPRKLKKEYKNKGIFRYDLNLTYPPISYVEITLDY